MTFPTPFYIESGRRYTCRVGDHTLRLYRKDNLYYVTWDTKSHAFWSYRDARKFASKVILAGGNLNVR